MNRNYERITNQIIKQLEHGVVPWRQPWLTARNLVSSKPYRGVNALLLGTLGRESPWWVTFRQAQQLGGTVRKGEHGVRVIFWKPRTNDDNEEELRPPILKTYTVFNLEQRDDIDAPPTPESVVAIENVVATMPSPPRITTGSAASYQASTDTVTLPALASFKAAAGYYATLYHEAGHASGHKQRLNRPGFTGKHAFGSTEYAKEELIAEISAAFLCGETGITPQTIENNTAYIANWLKVLNEQPSMLVHAAAAAQKTADHILNREGNTRGAIDEDAQTTDRPAGHNEERPTSNSPLAA